MDPLGSKAKVVYNGELLALPLAAIGLSAQRTRGPLLGDDSSSLRSCSLGGPS